ncbi:MAG: hypothetical protein U0746_22960 [Gemmataceae bacterium]
MRLARFDETNLYPGVASRRLNASLVECDGGYAIAFRSRWHAAEIYVGRLDAGLAPVGDPVRLCLRHVECSWGREDPRLFWHSGALHCAFVAARGTAQLVSMRQSYARLGDDFRVEAMVHPPYARRNRWEKNWQFFSHDGDLFAVYTVAPHRVLRVTDGTAVDAYETANPLPWSGGLLRGGAPPIRVGNEYWCFFHGLTQEDGVRTYNVGVYTFEARPPFRVLRQTSRPILIADATTRPEGQYANVVFPCGAVLRESSTGRQWIVSCGIHDRWTEVYGFSWDEVESALQPAL